MRIVVHGGVPLQGTFQPSGNSNAALALTAAALLTDAPVTLNNVPDTLSTTVMFDAARVLGAEITRDGETRPAANARAAHARAGIRSDRRAGQHGAAAGPDPGAAATCAAGDRLSAQPSAHPSHRAARSGGEYPRRRAA